MTELEPNFLVSRSSQEFRESYYPDSSVHDWNDWHWQLRKRLTTLADFRKILNLNNDELSALCESRHSLSVGITPYYASLIRNVDNDPLRKTVIPRRDELSRSPGEFLDPLAEDAHSPVPGLVHRYPDRVLFLVTDFCPVYCRYCTRSRLVGGNAQFDINLRQWQRGIDYIATTPAIRDVLISGGDPLVYPDERIDWLLARLRSIRHVEVLRIGTKIPFVMPQRVTPSLASVLRQYHPLYISLHVIHPREITEESGQACGRLADAGVPLGSQTVLLRNVNDHPDTMRQLMHQLLRIRVKPYYLLQCDPVYGTSHFRTPIETGVSLIRGLRGHTSGYAVPQFVVDLPKGGGKVPLVPEYQTGLDADDYIFSNYEGKSDYRYPRSRIGDTSKP